MGNFNKLTSAETERLALLLEELGEAQQAIGKILRHGYESKNPDDVNSITNRQALEREIGDVIASVQLMEQASDLSSITISERVEVKLEKVKLYFHHN